ncbi:MAG TPA: Eco57I restriction-modification methylase domain-containing protein [Candidatus Paceibacterota bacterium]|nr:Eco57I restriction-modification methylase domain-containing protein [Candidatus Paceibacterota bacterium]
MRVDSKKVQLAQPFIPGLSPIQSAVDELAAANIDDRGAIFTRREVVDFILDLVGYTPDKSLQDFRLLEPSFGHGDFLIPAIERLMMSIKRQKLLPTADLLKESIRGVELHVASFGKTVSEVREILIKNELRERDADEVLDAWFVRGDFLLSFFGQSFTHVVGNPPYIRQEMVPNALMAEYRRRFDTIYDRADIYVPFIEYSLRLLDEGGVLGFICADRWMKNRYGGPLRDLVAAEFHLRAYVDMINTHAFHSEVIAYPAITVIAREPSGPTRIAKQPEIEAGALEQLSKALRQDAPHSKILQTTVREGGPWTLDESDALTFMRRLEVEFPTLEEAGCKVGIGVATGADSVFIAPFAELDVEVDRKLPLAMTKDIQSGKVEWRGFGVINPFGEDGKLVSLSEYPKLRDYLEQHSETIKSRHVSKKNPNGWYRTIDRIYPELVAKPKLLIPDIKGDAHIVYEEGKFYPHHNLYYITSDSWDLQALRSVLSSGIARLFIEAYSTRMHGNCLRFQAQYLRRIRLPQWSDVPKDLRRQLRIAAEKDDVAAREDAVSRLYSLSPSERATIYR